MPGGESCISPYLSEADKQIAAEHGWRTGQAFYSAAASIATPEILYFRPHTKLADPRFASCDAFSGFSVRCMLGSSCQHLNGYQRVAI